MENGRVNIEIDKLTNSIENALTGDSFVTEVSLLATEDLKSIKGWEFDWVAEFKKSDRDIYKLTIVNNTNIIQGLISVAVKQDHVFVHLIENAPFNKTKNKVYVGVAGNLVAFACRLSFQRGCEGYVSFIAKTKLVDHYTSTLGAAHIRNGLMVIATESALRLTNRYFKG